MMELLLIANVKDLGRQYEVVKVDRDLALKKLLPQRLAIVLTPQVRRRFRPMIVDRANAAFR